MKKTLVLIIIFLCVVGVALAAQNYRGVNIDTRSNSWTKERDWYTTLDQAGNNGTFSNLTVDNLKVINSPVNCPANTGMIGTNMTTSTCSNNITDWYRIGDDTVYLLGNVGIGTASPDTLLDVEDNAVTLATIQTTATNAEYAGLNVKSPVGTWGLYTGADGHTLIDGDFGIHDWDAGVYRFVIKDTGNVGMGTSNPGRKLDLQGTASVYMEFHATDHNQWVIGSESRGFVFYDDTTNDYRMVIQNVSGNVGIGTTSPAALLTVDGTMLILNTSGRALMNVTNTYVSFPGIAGTDNEVIGAGAGISLLSTGTDNTIVGDNAGAAITTADYTVLIGANADVAGGTSGYGTGIGSNSIVGASAVAIGNQAEAGSYSIAIGAGAVNMGGRGISIGTLAGEAQGAADVDNVLIGSDAGREISGTGTDNTCVGDLACNTLTSGDGNVIIGADADVGATTTNSIAIGFGATCNFNNAATFGTGASCTGDNMLAIGSPTSNLDIVLYGGLNSTENITAENVFLPQYIFVHDNETLLVDGAGLWTNISFSQEEAELKQGITHTHNDRTNTTFTINADGIYYLSSNLDVIDTSASATTIDVASRIIFANGTEIPGSVFEVDIIKQQVETELTHEMLARLKAGDKIIFQFIADDADVEISTHGTFGDNPESVSIIIEKRYNLPGQGG